VHTTSHPPRRSRGKDADTPQPRPIQSIRLTVSVSGPAAGGLKRLAAERGLTVQEEGGKVSLVITSETPEDALAQLDSLRGILTPKA
jgi:hypothetical protein